MRHAAFLIALSCGCAAGRNVTIPAPPAATAPLQERVAYYEAWSPVAAEKVTTNYTYGGQAAGSVVELGSVELANGARVSSPRDLLPAVKPDSPTADAVRAHESARLWQLGSLMVIPAGVACGALIACGSPFTLVLGGRSDAVVGGMMLGAGIGMGSLLVPLVPAGISGFAAERERERAFETYDGSLRDRLAIQEKPEASAHGQP